MALVCPRSLRALSCRIGVRPALLNLASPTGQARGGRAALGMVGAGRPWQPERASPRPCAVGGGTLVFGGAARPREEPGGERGGGPWSARAHFGLSLAGPAFARLFSTLLPHGASPWGPGGARDGWGRAAMAAERASPRPCAVGGGKLVLQGAARPREEPGGERGGGPWSARAHFGLSLAGSGFAGRFYLAPPRGKPVGAGPAVLILAPPPGAPAFAEPQRTGRDTFWSAPAERSGDGAFSPPVGQSGPRHGRLRGPRQSGVAGLRPLPPHSTPASKLGDRFFAVTLCCNPLAPGLLPSERAGGQARGPAPTGAWTERFPGVTRSLHDIAREGAGQ